MPVCVGQTSRCGERKVGDAFAEMEFTPANLDVTDDETMVDQIDHVTAERRAERAGVYHREAARHLPDPGSVGVAGNHELCLWAMKPGHICRALRRHLPGLHDAK